MALMTEIVESEKHWSLWGAKIPTKCFVCHKPMFFPLVYWVGCPGEWDCYGYQIWMHPDCARQLGKALIQDADKAPPPLS